MTRVNATTTTEAFIETPTYSEHSTNLWATAYIETSQTWLPDAIQAKAKIAYSTVTPHSLLDEAFTLQFFNIYSPYPIMSKHCLLDYWTVYVSHPTYRHHSMAQALYFRLGSDWAPTNMFLLTPISIMCHFEQYGLEGTVKASSLYVTRAFSSFVHSHWLANKLLTNFLTTFESIRTTIDLLNPESPLLHFMLPAILALFTLVLIIHPFVVFVTTKLLPFIFTGVFIALPKATVNVLLSARFASFGVGLPILYVLLDILSSANILEQIERYLSSSYVVFFIVFIFLMWPPKE